MVAVIDLVSSIKVRFVNWEIQHFIELWFFWIEVSDNCSFGRLELNWQFHLTWESLTRAFFFLKTSRLNEEDDEINV